VVTFLGDLLIGGLLLVAAWLLNRFGSPLALPRGVVRAVFPSRFSDETQRRVATFQDRALAASVGVLGLVVIVGGVVNFIANL
jgi:hypothetical protein